MNYPYLNSWTIKNAYPLPRLNEISEITKGWTHFSVIDVKQGFNNIRMASEKDERLAAFITKRGLFQPTVMFFRLCNSLATFQSFIDDIYQCMIWEKEVRVYMDDLLTEGLGSLAYRDRTH